MTLKIREPGSAITHFIAMLLALFSAAPLLVRSALRSDATSLAAMSVFICSMILLYGASTVSYTHLDVYKRQILLLPKIVTQSFARVTPV